MGMWMDRGSVGRGNLSPDAGIPSLPLGPEIPDRTPRNTHENVRSSWARLGVLIAPSTNGNLALHDRLMLDRCSLS